MKKLFFILLIICSPSVMADSLNLIINGKAFHQNDKNYNENNWGLGFEYNFKEKDKWINFANGGYFKDSNRNQSNYLGGGSKRRFLLTDDEDGWRVDAGFTAFIMTRKDFKDNQPFFGALPYLSIGKGRFAINATYIPKADPKLEALIFIQASYQISEW